MTRPSPSVLPTTPKPEGRKRKYREGVLWGRSHRWIVERDGHRAACGLTVNVAQPEWSGEGEECPRCYQEEVEGERIIIVPVSGELHRY